MLAVPLLRHRETIGAKMWQVDRERHGPRLEASKRALGDEAYEAARQAGRAFSVNDAVDYALDVSLKVAAFEE